MDSKGLVYLIPSLLDEHGVEAIPPYVMTAVKDCNIFFVENERTARRYLKRLSKELAEDRPGLIIDEYEWCAIEEGPETPELFKQRLKEGKTIGIISEAGCPGVADPGQTLVALAHQANAPVRPLVGPSSILLALMASGLNGQLFQFCGYLPIGDQERARAIRELESQSQKKNCTKIFIETPYRNNQLVASLIKICRQSTRLCIAVGLTGPSEWISTKTIAEWKKEDVNIHKRPAMFLLLAGS
jgi:16S rRNA (cytidine1402-2'-O)-methyltransferase